jgi:outer membrane protein OmpA-like peptidoglycan-associated protein
MTPISSPFRLALPAVLAAAASLAGCATPHSQPVLSHAVMDARAHLDASRTAACPAPASPTSIGFGFGEASLGDTANTPLERLATTLTCRPQVSALIVGEADGHGTAEDQKKLAQSRAQAVSDYLSAHGVAARRLAMQVEGKAPPAGEARMIVMAEGRRW